MDALRSILPKVLHKRGLHTHASAAHVTHATEKWLKNALPHLATFIAVDKLSHATLSISCTHGMAAQECMPLLPALRDYLKREFPRAPVADIRLTRG